MEISHQELTDAIRRLRAPDLRQVRFPNTTASHLLAKNLLADIENTRLQRATLTIPVPDPAFTEEEIEEAVAEYGYGLDAASRFSREIVRLGLALRKRKNEPVWQPGDVVKDANGEIWRRITGTHPWVQFGSQAKYREESPVRPLKKVEV